MGDIYSYERLAEGLMQPNEEMVARIESLKDEMDRIGKMKTIIQSTNDLDSYIAKSIWIFFLKFKKRK